MGSSALGNCESIPVVRCLCHFFLEASNSLNLSSFHPQRSVAEFEHVDDKAGRPKREVWGGSKA